MSSETDDIREEEMDVGPADLAEEEAAAVSPEERVKLLHQSLTHWTKEAAEANEKYLRMAADFENYRKRMQRDIADFRKYANEQLALELLSVVDHLALALKHSGEGVEMGQNLRQGVELVFKQLRDILEKYGVKSFSAEGEVFDPARHDALMQVVTSDVPENTVAVVMQEGYLYHEKILRHAKVGVAKKPENEKQEEVELEEQRGDEPM